MGDQETVSVVTLETTVVNLTCIYRASSMIYVETSQYWSGVLSISLVNCYKKIRTNESYISISM